MHRHFLATTALAVILSAPAGAQSVSNAPDPSVPPGGQFFGTNGVPTVGQTFTAPAGTNSLTTFSFFLANDQDFGGGADLSFRPYLMVWSGDHPTGTNLLPASPVYAGNSTSDYFEYVFAAGVPVTPGDVYVAFLSTVNVPQPGDGYNQFEGTSATYTGGQLVYADTPPGGDDATSPNAVWYDGAGAQLAFNAQFSTVTPEPSELVLLGTGLTSLVGFARIRRRRATLV